MKRNLKHIKITGALKSRGEYATASSDYRPYEAVSIVDESGEEVHFHSLSISKRMDEEIALGKRQTFYILRVRAKDTMSGILYAVATDERKIFYKDVEPVMRFFAAQWGTNLGAIGMGCRQAVPPGCSIALSSAVPFIGNRKAGIPEMRNLLLKDGFSLKSSNNPSNY